MNEEFLKNIKSYGKWRENLVTSINAFQKWLEVTELDNAEQSLKIFDILQNLSLA